MRRGLRKLTRLLGLAVVVFGSMATGGAAVVLDWAAWEGFVDGSDKKQTFINADGVVIEYQPHESNANGQPRPQYLFDSPAIRADGAGGMAMFIEQTAEPGDSTRNRFTVKGGGDFTGISLTVGGIDGATTGGANYIDELQFSAQLTDGSTIAPTRVFVTNALLVGPDTITAIPNTGLTGSVEVFFDSADIERIQLVFRNSTTGTAANIADTMGIRVGDIFETGLTAAPIPEPGCMAFIVFGGAVALRRRRSRGGRQRS